MILLHSIGNSEHSNVNSIEEIKNSKGTLTFDGVYKSVYDNRRALEGRDIILLVMGSYVGKDNSFDKGRHYQEQYCTWEQIREMGFKIGWHTWNHKDLTLLSDDELAIELKPPFPMEYIAYPHGKFNDRVIKEAKKHFKFGLSVDKGDNSDFQIKRKYL